jgi:hypothetical protein
VGKYRVNIDEKRTDAENGFLVELDAYASSPRVTVAGYRYGIKSDVHSEEQIEFIEDYLTAVDMAIYLGDKEELEKLADLNSFVDMYLLQEFAKNIDVGWSSFFMYRNPGGKLMMAPPWDFDLAFGNDNRLDKGSYEDLYTGVGRKGFMQNHEWFIMLYSQDWFREMAAARWREISNTVIRSLIDEIAAVAEEMLPDMNKNYERWLFLGHKQQQEPSAIVALTTYKEHADYLVNWMEQRKAWLDDYFLV